MVGIIIGIYLVGSIVSVIDTYMVIKDSEYKNVAFKTLKNVYIKNVLLSWFMAPYRLITSYKRKQNCKTIQQKPDNNCKL